MPAKTWKNRRLVIDTDVLVNATESQVPTSIACRKYLEVVLDIGYYIVQTPDIRREWDDHVKREYARRWLATLERKDKIIEFESEEVRNDQLRDRIQSTTFRQVERTDKAHRAMAKDVRWIEAALKADKNVSSGDDTVRELFALVCPQIEELREIVWINPKKSDEEKPLDWLKKGAKPEKSRRLEVYLRKKQATSLND